MKKYFGLLVLPLILTGCVVQTPTSDDVLSSLKESTSHQIEELKEEVQKESHKNQTVTQNLTIDVNQKGIPFVPAFTGTFNLAQEGTVLGEKNVAESDTGISITAKIDEVGDVNAALNVESFLKENTAFMSITNLKVEAPAMLPTAIEPTDPVLNTWYEVSEATITEMLTSLGTPEEDIKEITELFTKSIDRKNSTNQALAMIDAFNKMVLSIESTGEITEENELWVVPAKISAQSMLTFVEDIEAALNLPAEESNTSIEDFDDIDLLIGVQQQNIVEHTLEIPYFIGMVQMSSTDDFDNTNDLKVSLSEDIFTFEVIENEKQNFVFTLDTEKETFKAVEPNESGEDVLVFDGNIEDDKMNATFYDAEKKETGTLTANMHDDKLSGQIVMLGETEGEKNTTINFTAEEKGHEAFAFNMNIKNEDMLNILIDYNVQIKKAHDKNLSVPADAKSITEFVEALQNDPSLLPFTQGMGQAYGDEGLGEPMTEEELAAEQEKFRAWIEGMTEEEAQETFGASKAELLQSFEEAQ